MPDGMVEHGALRRVAPRAAAQPVRSCQGIRKTVLKTEKIRADSLASWSVPMHRDCKLIS